MKFLFAILLLTTLQLSAQVDLKFDKRFVESEDRWVAFRMDKDSSFPYGFIYIDAQAGLTFNYEGDFRINTSGEYVPEKVKEANIKIRLQPNNVLVAFIPQSRFSELQINAVPDWLKHYKNDTGSAKRLYRWGYLYNAWNECKRALTFLEQARKIDPAFEGLNVELAFSYNCLREYDKAQQILEEEIKRDPRNAYVNKEYIFSASKNNNIEKAVIQFERSVSEVENKSYHAENSYNILQYFYTVKDKKNFKKWYKELQKWPSDNKMMKQYADKMRDDID